MSSIEPTCSVPTAGPLASEAKSALYADLAASTKADMVDRDGRIKSWTHLVRYYQMVTLAKAWQGDDHGLLLAVKNLRGQLLLWQNFLEHKMATKDNQ